MSWIDKGHREATHIYMYVDKGQNPGFIHNQYVICMEMNSTLVTETSDCFILLPVIYYVVL